VTPARRSATRAAAPSNPTTIRQPPTPPPDDQPIASGSARLTADSDSSESRSTVGWMPDWAIARTAATPSAKVGQRQPSYTFSSGTGRTRTVTEVITPKAPSEPSTSWRRSGPAAVAGAEPRVIVPVGVTTVRPTTSASKRPYPADAWPLDRV